jgi:hypothetical protein
MRRLPGRSLVSPNIPFRREFFPSEEGGGVTGDIALHGGSGWIAP